MVNLPLYNLEGKESGSIPAKDDIFGRPADKSVIHSALVWILDTKRQGTSSAKTRSEVRGGGKKPWAQKGTGRARSGSIRSPLWRGGGVTFGPKPRDYSFNLPKKARKVAIVMALSDKAKSGKIRIIEKIESKDGKTKNTAAFLKTLVTGDALMAFDDSSEALTRSAKNLKSSKLVLSKDLNIFDILKYEWLILDKSAVANIEERYKKI